MRILHIITRNLDEVAEMIIELQRKNHNVEVINLLNEENVDYDALIDKIITSDRVISW